MLKSRIEINDLGEFIIVVPDEVIDAYELDEGELLEWDINDRELIILSSI